MKRQKLLQQLKQTGSTDPEPNKPKTVEPSLDEPVQEPEKEEKAYESTENTHSDKNGYLDKKDDKDDDNDEDDMFADSPVHKPTSAKSKKGQLLDSNLLDNWDDEEGYYRIIPGELLDDRYSVISKLGQGVFATVVRASDQTAKLPESKLVAIKIIRSNETMAKEGLKELATLEKINSFDPQGSGHVIQLLTSFDHKKHLCLVFENMESNLRDILKKFGKNVGLNIVAIQSYTRQLLLGLSLLHTAKIIHADLKPDNLLVNDKHNTLKIGDLGSASNALHASENPITEYLASRFYRAPEIILGLPYGLPIDMWSVGCTLYELYTGQVLFPGKSNNEMLKLIMQSKGKFNHKMIKKGSYSSKHFDLQSFDFLSLETDSVTKELTTKHMKITGTASGKTIKERLTGMEDSNDSQNPETKKKVKLLNQFIDLLDGLLTLNPDKRLTPVEALAHPFVRI